MSKKVSYSLDTWDIYLNHLLPAIRFNINESTKFAPFVLFYNHDPVLPIDNILNQQEGTLGQEPQKIGLEQHKLFVMIHYQHLKKAKRIQARYPDKNSQYTEFEVGHSVYLITTAVLK